jgi:uncharacterized protein with HEPN domain
MSKRIPKLLIIDMQECVSSLEEYTSNMDYGSFLSDRKTRDAVLRNIQVLGEAANRLPDDLKKNYPEVEWGKIIRSRHIVTHDYSAIDYSIIWRIATVHRIPLKESLLKIIKSFEG